MTPAEDLQQLLTPDCVKIVPKRSVAVWRAVGWLQQLIMRHDDFMMSAATTIGQTIYMPACWYNTWDDLTRLEVLRHELHHVDQFNRWGLGILIPYLLLPLPFGLAYCRYRMERTAYVAGFRKVLQYHPNMRQSLIDYAVEELCGPAYGWCWPFRGSVGRWFDQQLPTKLT